MAAVACRIRKHTGIPVILLAHNLIPHENQPGTLFLTRRLLSNVDGLVALSASVADDARTFGPASRLMVIPHPVYDSYGDRCPKRKPSGSWDLTPVNDTCLFFGLVRKYKGLDLLLRAIPMVEARDVTVIVAGEFYDKKEDYLVLADELNINFRVIIRDEYIPDDVVKYYFSAADLVVQPYRSATQSGVTQIAYHFEVPMVVSDAGGLPEIVEDGVTGFVVKPEPEMIAGAINRFFSLPQQPGMLRMSGKEKKSSPGTSSRGAYSPLPERFNPETVFISRFRPGEVPGHTGRPERSDRKVP